MVIDVAQFLRPNGQVRQVTVDLPGVIDEQYAKLRNCNVRITAEVLTADEVSLCLEHPECGDFDSRVVSNGPDVPRSLSDMINGFCQLAFEGWHADVLGC